MMDNKQVVWVTTALDSVTTTITVISFRLHLQHRSATSTTHVVITAAVERSGTYTKHSPETDFGHEYTVL